MTPWRVAAVIVLTVYALFFWFTAIGWAIEGNQDLIAKILIGLPMMVSAMILWTKDS